MRIRLAIVDDDVQLSKSLRNDLLEFDEIKSVITSSSGLGFVKELGALPVDQRPEVIIMDISMSQPDEGIRATRQIKDRFPEIEIVMFTISDEDERIFEAFKSGAMGYLLKNEPPSFILKTILDVRLGGAQMSPSIARKAIRYFTQQSKNDGYFGGVHDDALSDRENEILQYVAKGMTYQQIGEVLFISPNTVKKHMVNIFSKLQVKNKIEALKKVEKLQ